MIIIQRLLLASSSPFRKKLLASTGAEFFVEAPQVDEYALIGAHTAETCALRARAKAQAVASIAPGSLSIGCDQILDLAGETFDKATSEVEARQRLAHFSGKTHHLINHIALANHNQSNASSSSSDTSPIVVSEFSVVVPMTMRNLNDAEVDAYIATGEWRGSVGCYQFENRGIHLFENTMEDCSAVVGLPLQQLLNTLRILGINLLTQPKGPWQLRQR